MTDGFSFLNITVETKVLLAGMIIVAVHEYRPLRDALYIHFLTLYLSIGTDKLEIRNGGFLYAQRWTQFILWKDNIFNLPFIILDDKLIVICLVHGIHLFLPTPVLFLADILHCLDEENLQLAILNDTAARDIAHRTVDVFPMIQLVNNLLEQFFSSCTAQVLALPLVSIAQDTMVAAVLAFSLTFTVADMLIADFYEF